MPHVPIDLMRCRSVHVCQCHEGISTEPAVSQQKILAEWSILANFTLQHYPVVGHLKDFSVNNLTSMAAFTWTHFLTKHSGIVFGQTNGMTLRNSMAQLA